MGKFNTTRYNILFYFFGFAVCIHNYTYSQSKKEQIQFLETRLDSLKTIQDIEKLKFENSKNNFESTITNFNQYSKEISKALQTKKQELTNYIQENKKLDQDIKLHQTELKKLKDSIQQILENQPIKLLDSSLITISDDQIIHLMNIHDEDLGEAFINTDSPEIKPFYKIIGKQLFRLKGKMFCMVVVGVRNPNDSHPNFGTNYIACFEIKYNSWKLLHPPKNTKSKPSVGFGEYAWLNKFIVFGEKSLAVILEGGDSGMGLDLGNRAIYGFDETKNVFLLYEGQSHENDEGNKGMLEFQNIDDVYEIDFHKSTSSKFYDLIETKKSHGRKEKVKTLKFNEINLKYE